MDQHDRFPGEQMADVGIVEPARLGMQQVQDGRVGPPPRHRLQAMDAAARSGHHLDGVARVAHERVEGGVVASGQPQAPPARQPPARPRRTAVGDACARTIARGDQARLPELAVGPGHRPRRAPELRGEPSCRRQRRSRRPPAVSDLARQRLREILHQLQPYSSSGRVRSLECSFASSNTWRRSAASGISAARRPRATSLSPPSRPASGASSTSSGFRSCGAVEGSKVSRLKASGSWVGPSARWQTWRASARKRAGSAAGWRGCCGSARSPRRCRCLPASRPASASAIRACGFG